MSEEVKEYPLDEERAQKAYDALVKYLALSARSEKECKEKLYGKGYHKDEVEFAIAKAKKYNYINDEEYVRTYLMFNSNRYGAKKIVHVSKNPRDTSNASLTLVIILIGNSPIFSFRRFLSSVRICSSKTTLSLGSPNLPAGSSICVGSFAFPSCDVTAAAIMVGLYLFPTLF